MGPQRINKTPIMFTAKRMIKKTKDAEPDDFEKFVAQEMSSLTVSNGEIGVALNQLYITAAKEVEVGSGKAVMIFVPFKQLRAFHRIQARLVRELEKKFAGRHVVILANRTMLGKNYRRSKKVTGPRPRSRTLTSIHENILEDLVFPTEIVGKRTRCRMDGSKLLKVYLDSKDQHTVETKIDTFVQVYKKLTSKEVTFEFQAK